MLEGGVGGGPDNLTMPIVPDWPGIPVSETVSLATSHERNPLKPTVQDVTAKQVHGHVVVVDGPAVRMAAQWERQPGSCVNSSTPSSGAAGRIRPVICPSNACVDLSLDEVSGSYPTPSCLLSACNRITWLPSQSGVIASSPGLASLNT